MNRMAASLLPSSSTCSDVCRQSLTQGTARQPRTGCYFVLAAFSKAKDVAGDNAGRAAFRGNKERLQSAMGRCPLQPAVNFPSYPGIRPVTPNSGFRASASGEGRWGRGRGRGEVSELAADSPSEPRPAPTFRCRDAGEIRLRGAQPLRDGTERRRPALPRPRPLAALTRRGAPSQRGKGKRRAGPSAAEPVPRGPRSPCGRTASIAGRALAPSHGPLSSLREVRRPAACRALPPGSIAISWPPAAQAGRGTAESR